MLEPKEVVGIYDNDETIDRYQIHLCFDDGEEYLLSSSHDPSWPLGVFHGSKIENQSVFHHVGEKINWVDLPSAVKKKVYQYV